MTYFDTETRGDFKIDVYSEECSWDSRMGIFQECEYAARVTGRDFKKWTKRFMSYDAAIEAADAILSSMKAEAA